ncbi:MAG: LemA family protein [Candidatus Micrarchaeota archaeon]
MLDIILIVLVIIVVFILLFFVLMYNNLITLRARVNNAWSQIDVQLTKRYEMVPNLVETVKGYAKHEKEVFEKVTRARSQWSKASTVGEKAKADNMFAGALKSLLMVAENYPKLRANENFKLLQEQLEGIESKVAYARQFYNDSVLEYNTKIQHMPDALMANILSFTSREYFKAEGGARKAIKVKF